MTIQSSFFKDVNDAMTEDARKRAERCRFIYRPKGRAGEYAGYAANPYTGCGHSCSYCYVPNVTKMKRSDFDAKATPRIDFVRNFTRDAKLFQLAEMTPNVLFSFMTDPYNRDDVEHELTRQCLIVLRDHGLSFTTLTKGGRRALRDIDLFRSGKDYFASTLTTLDAGLSEKWERGAASPDERIKVMSEFKSSGIGTWASLEPVLDADHTIQIIKATAGIVDFYKVGKMNYVDMGINWRDFGIRAINALESIGANYMIKKDLEAFLPDEYRGRGNDAE